MRKRNYTPSHAVTFAPLLAIILLVSIVSESPGQTRERQGGFVQGSRARAVLPPANAVTDGGFEAGIPNPNWNESSTNFGTPLCDAGCSGGTNFARSGSYWAWFGGSINNEHGNLSQNVTISPGDTLRFWTRFPVCNNEGDSLNVKIDGTAILQLTSADPSCGGGAYILRSTGLGGFADGGQHLLEFDSPHDNTGLSNFFVDDVTLSQFALPVELASFAARVTEDGAMLSWTTASETNNSGFEIEHALDDTPFEPIAFIVGHGTSAQAQSYHYVVGDLSPGRHAFRLKQIDFDGAFEYSKTIEAVVTVPNQIWLAPIYPNPFNPTTIVSFAVPTDQRVRVQVYDVTGRLVRTLFDGIAPSNTQHHVRFNGDALQSGVYLVRAEGTGMTATQTVTLLK